MICTITRVENLQFFPDDWKDYDGVPGNRFKPRRFLRLATDY
jgi:hypothetical protein